MNSFNNDHDQNPNYNSSIRTSSQHNRSLIEEKIQKRPEQSSYDTIDPTQFNWASGECATVHSLDYLLSKGITTVSSDVECKKCGVNFNMEFELISNFLNLKEFIKSNKIQMAEKAANEWKNPVLPDCKFCDGKNCVNPVRVDKEDINWLFLLLGNMLGCCTLEELKYFCKYNEKHRSGSKDCVLYLTYLTLCNQLQPDDIFS